MRYRELKNFFRNLKWSRRRFQWFWSLYRTLETERKLEEKISNALSIRCLPPFNQSFVYLASHVLARQCLTNTCWNCMFCELLSGVFIFVSYSLNVWVIVAWPTVNVHIASFGCLVECPSYWKQFKIYF